MSDILSSNEYKELKNQIKELIVQGRAQAGYGSELLDRLSRDLHTQFGKGFSRSNLFQMRQFYLKFPKIQTLSGKLSWSHYAEIIKADDELEISFYVKKDKQQLKAELERLLQNA